MCRIRRDADFFSLLPGVHSIKEHNNGEIIPTVVKACISFLNNENALQTEGIFRRSANTTTVKELQEEFNNGQVVDFGDQEQAVHSAAVILKSFFRELEEPICEYDRLEYRYCLNTDDQYNICSDIRSLR